MDFGNSFSGKIFAIFPFISHPSIADIIGGNIRGPGKKNKRSALWLAEALYNGWGVVLR